MIKNGQDFENRNRWQDAQKYIQWKLLSLIFYLFIKHELRDSGIPGIILNFGYKDELDMGPAF